MSDLKPPLVSVIMNCYNGEKYLKEAINSVYEQTYHNWEIIFWDNNSSDKSSVIANSYDEKLKYFKAEKTTSLGEARALAVKSSGRYLAFLDCDDFWFSQKLSLQVKVFLKNPNVAVVYGLCELIYEDSFSKKIIPKLGRLKEGHIFDELVKEDFIPFPSILLDKIRFIECGGFPIHFKSATDYWVLLHLAVNYEFRAIKNVCCVYRTHQYNLSHKLAETSVLEAIELISMFLPTKSAKLGLRYQYVNLAIVYFRNKLFMKSLSILIRKKILLLGFQRIIKKFFLKSYQ